MKEKLNKIYNGNNLDVLKNFEDNSIDALISDFPYALSFMNAKWDTMPRLKMLKEFYRVLKAGSFLVTTFTPRLDLQSELCMLLKEAGFDVSFSPLYWAYKSGFPKASSYSKSIDKYFNAEREVVGFTKQGTKSIFDGGKERKSTIPSKYLDGLYSLSLKPAVEPIIIAQKPHGKAKYKQALDWYYERKELLDNGIPEEDLSLYTKNASGGVWIDNGRIPCSNEKDIEKMSVGFKGLKFDGDVYHKSITQTTSFISHSQGRFPANLLCGFSISKEELRSEYPEATEEELEKMVNMIESPLDVGRVSKATPNARHNRNDLNEIFKGTINTTYGHDDTGDLSRYFSLTAWSKKHFPNLHNVAEKTLQLQEDIKKTGDCLFVCKPAQSEKNAGLERFESKNVKDGRQAEVDNAFQRGETLRQNTHPTTKPISLYNYLIALFSKDGDIILDPFCGSGTTLIACVLTNRKYIGIEMSEEYYKIAEARVEYWKQQKEAVKIPYASKKNVSASKSIDTNQNSLF